MFAGVQVTVSPVDGLTAVARLTVLVKPFCPVTVTENEPVELPLRGSWAKL